MSKGRPVDWENPYKTLFDLEGEDDKLVMVQPCAEDVAFEAGADAILEALAPNDAMGAVLFGFMIGNDWIIDIEAKGSV